MTATLFDAAIDRYGKIDIVIANAGIEPVDVSYTDRRDDQVDVPAKRLAPRAVAFLVGDRVGLVTGHHLVVDGGAWI